MTFYPAVFCSIALALLSGCFSTETAPDPPADVVIDDTPADLFGLVESIPPTMSDPAGARELAAVCEEFARQLAVDGRREEPHVVDTAGLLACLTSANQYAFDGRRVATSAYVHAVGESFEEHFEPGGEVIDLSPELRTKAVEFFQALAWSLGEVTDGR